MVIFLCFLHFRQRQSKWKKKKHELLENRFPVTKTHFQDSWFRIHRPEVFLQKMTGGFLILLKMIFFKHVFICSKYKKVETKKSMKNVPSDNLSRPTPRTCSFFNCRLNMSFKYDALLMQANLKLVLRYMKNAKWLLNAWVVI